MNTHNIPIDTFMPRGKISLSTDNGELHLELIIKSFTATEYENDGPDIPAEIANLPELSTFE